MSDDPRQRLGRAGEDLAAEHLVRLGFEILERNYRTRWGELDLIAFDGATLAFCEVKTRRLARAGPAQPAGRVRMSPFDAIHPPKRTQVRRIARQWLAEATRRPYASRLRFDAIGVTLAPSGELVALDHLEGAF